MWTKSNALYIFDSVEWVRVHEPLPQMFFEDHIDDAKYCGHLYGLGSGSAYVQNGTGNAYEEEANKQQSWRHSRAPPAPRVTWTAAKAHTRHPTSCFPLAPAHLRQLIMMLCEFSPVFSRGSLHVPVGSLESGKAWKIWGFSFPKMFHRNVLHFKAPTWFYMESWTGVSIVFVAFPFSFVNTKHSKTALSTPRLKITCVYSLLTFNLLCWLSDIKQILCSTWRHVSSAIGSPLWCQCI